MADGGIYETVPKIVTICTPNDHVACPKSPKDDGPCSKGDDACEGTTVAASAKSEDV